jgi:hypothetical protein
VPHCLFRMILCNCAGKGITNLFHDTVPLFAMDTRGRGHSWWWKLCYLSVHDEGFAKSHAYVKNVKTFKCYLQLKSTTFLLEQFTRTWQFS